MKNFGILMLLTVLISLGFNLRLSADYQDVNKNEDNKTGTDEKTRVTFGKDLLSVESKDSTLNVRIRNRGLNILESLEGDKFRFEKYDENKSWFQDDKEERHERRRNRFRGHWTGIELGFNNYLTSRNSLTLPTDIDYMTLHTGKSVNFNINFSQLSFGLTKHIGFVTGLGLTWNNYVFDGNNNIVKGENGVIQELNPGVSLKKSKLTTVFLDLPVLFEVQLPVDNHHIHIAAGPIGALKLGSHSKIKYADGSKVKENGDFSLNVLRYGATARVGYQNFHLYGTYYYTPLFMSGKGPGGTDLYPYEIGVSFTFND